jgi:amino acid adenylation domain-containing protein
MRVLEYEMTMLYQGTVSGQNTDPLPPLPIQYRDYTLWQRQWLTGVVLQEQLDYWLQQLKDAPEALNLPTDHPRPAIQTYRGAIQELLFPPALADQLVTISRQENVTLFMLLLSALQILLARYSGEVDISVGSPIANRRHTQTEDLIGFFVNTLVLRTNLSGNPTFSHLLQQVREICLQAYAHQDIPFEKVVEELKPARALSHSPLFQVMLVLQNTSPHAPASLDPTLLIVTPISVQSTTSKFDLTFSLIQTPQGLHCTCEYSTDLFEPDTIARMLANFQTLLEGIVQTPQAHLSDLPWMREAEREQLLVEWNATKIDYPQDLCVHQLFEQQVEPTPDAVALVFEDDVLTYHELNRRADQLAHSLQDLGIGPDDPVGICLQRCVEMPLAVLAVLKAGGAVVPIDPELPKERITYLLSDAQIAVLLTQHQIREQLPDQPAQTVVDGACGMLIRTCMHRNSSHTSAPTLAVAADLVSASAQPENLCYVIYTSGSAGVPKGVGVPHRVLVNLLVWHRRHLRGGVRTLQFARLSFDMSFYELFTTWCTGGMLFLVGESTRADVVALAHFLHDRAMEKVMQPVVMLHQLAALPEQWASHLQEVITAGEQLQITKAVTAFFEKLEKACLHNHYGPSETHVVTAHTLPGQVCEWPTYPPIGRPIANTEVYLLDEHLQPVPIGAVGELCIGGVSLARGYLGRADLTAERFVPHPFVGIVQTCGARHDPYSADPGARLYKTGDLARYRADGVIEFVGRRDHQVKLRGYRIELGEIEATLMRNSLVRDAVVLSHDNIRGVKQLAPTASQLVAYVVLNQNPCRSGDLASPGLASPESATSRDLREYLQAKLPDYMVPSLFVMLDALPLSSNGKVDRRALPRPDETGPEREITFVAPRTAAEEVVAGVWSNVLGVEQIGVHDSFFTLGGHSLLAVQLTLRLRKAFQVELPVRSLFEKPTVEGLVNEIAHLRGGRDIVEEIALVIKEIASLSEDGVQDILSR